VLVNAVPLQCLQPGEALLLPRIATTKMKKRRRRRTTLRRPARRRTVTRALCP
jgi:hypothetical protein